MHYSCIHIIFMKNIQEFYEVTLLNSQKSCQQKVEETNQVAEKWEKTPSLGTDNENQPKRSEVSFLKI
uniref:Uncharacterized protein n=1 Tax=Laticauda laticaudata TaxID=8630 RepID=A0A8C5RP78_LATLA